MYSAKIFTSVFLVGKFLLVPANTCTCCRLMCRRYPCLYGQAPRYLADHLIPASNAAPLSLSFPFRGACPCHRPNRLQEVHDASWVGGVHVAGGGGSACLRVGRTAQEHSSSPRPSRICQPEQSHWASLSTQHVRLSGVRLCRPDSLELAA